ncbi:MAG: MFS transporter [Oscillospiraceae bacterium]
MKQVTNKTIAAYCIPQFAVGLFTAMLNNYLIYFYQPSAESGLPTLITQGTIILGVLTVVGLLKAIGHVFDAVTDPLVASLSDKSHNPKGRRIPFMKWSAIPFGLSALLIFCVPQGAPGLVNNLWLAVSIWSYYLFYTLYMIPHGALLPEMITDQAQRVNAYTMHSLFFVTGSALGYVTPLIVSLLKKSGLDPVWAWRSTFAMFTVLGIILLLVPVLLIKERDYVRSVQPTVSLTASIKHAFANRHFRWVTLGQLLELTGMSFFQACIMYYVTSLMGLPEEASVAILAISIAGSLLLYPLVNRWAKRSGKRLPILLGCAVFTIAELIICFCADLPGAPMVKAVLLAVLVSFPFAVLNILPNSMMADVIQYDTITTGVNQEGIFSAARSFVTKLGTSLAIMIVPSLTVIGAAAGENIGRMGLKLTALVGGIFCLGAIFAFFMYKEKDVLAVIREARERSEVK